MPGRTIALHSSATEPMDWPDAAAAASASDGVTLFIASLEELRPMIDQHEGVLDASERDRAARFRFDADRERFILGHGWLRDVLGKVLGTPAADLRIVRGPFGKPHLEGHDLRFNFSDTKDAVLLGFGQGIDIGIDVETMHRRVDHEAVASHYFTPAETQHLSELTSDARKRRFLELWTRKEAVLKASGVGIMDDLKELRVLDGANTMVVSHPEFIRMSPPQYHVRTWRIGHAHLVSMASSAEVDVHWGR
ncbi:MAG TPA: 4'-phosphopantetheinyl transferase superfamily protein [Flavobacteriales bacterium]|nr:4'-phosphopantetheinyl transferase superfamily protein [Flavobacteriales bacterium]